MTRLLIACVATAAAFGLQNRAEAILVNVLVDDFSVPVPQQISAPGGTMEALPMSVMATQRTLDASIGALAAGNGNLNLTMLPGSVGTMTLLLSDAAFAATNPVLHLTGFSGVGQVAVEAFYGASSLGTVAYSTPQGVTDLSWFIPGAPPAPEGQIAFVFTAGGAGFFGGSADSVVANPEPATMALMGLGVLGGAIGYRRRRRDDEVVPTTAS